MEIQGHAHAWNFEMELILGVVWPKEFQNISKSVDFLGAWPDFLWNFGFSRDAPRRPWAAAVFLYSADLGPRPAAAEVFLLF